MFTQSKKDLYCHCIHITLANPINYLTPNKMIKYGISFSLRGQIQSIYRREFDFKDAFNSVKEALLSREDFGTLADTFCLIFYRVNSAGMQEELERYYSDIYPDYLKDYLGININRNN